MDVDFHEKEGMFTSQPSTEEGTLSESQHNNHQYGSCSDSISSGLGSFLWSSSGCSTPLESELGSTEMDSDEDNFIAELTRQMADTMLQDEDEDEDDEKNMPDCGSENAKGCDQSENCSACNSNYLSPDDQRRASVASNANSPDMGIYSNQAFNCDQELGQIEYYQLQNQPCVKKEGSVYWGKSGGEAKITRLSGQVEAESEQQPNKNHRQKARKNRVSGGALVPGARACPVSSFTAGSDMRVVVLGGCGFKSRYSGTGVFLPRGPNSPTERRTKSGCSTVLIPTRVLQVLNLHFSNRDALSQPNAYFGSPVSLTQHQRAGFSSNSQQEEYSESQVESATNDEDLNLPHEWSYE